MRVVLADLVKSHGEKFLHIAKGESRPWPETTNDQQGIKSILEPRALLPKDDCGRDLN
jgi:hypothetical protein